MTWWDEIIHWVFRWNVHFQFEPEEAALLAPIAPFAPLAQLGLGLVGIISTARNLTLVVSIEVTSSWTVQLFFTPVFILNFGDCPP